MKQLAQISVVDANAGIDHIDRDMSGMRHRAISQAHSDAAGLGKFDGVADQVDQNLFDQAHVAADADGVGR